MGIYTYLYSSKFICKNNGSLSPSGIQSKTYSYHPSQIQHTSSCLKVVTYSNPLILNVSPNTFCYTLSSIIKNPLGSTTPQLPAKWNPYIVLFGFKLLAINLQSCNVN